jgi:hypothetical protein
LVKKTPISSTKPKARVLRHFGEAPHAEPAALDWIGMVAPPIPDPAPRRRRLVRRAELALPLGDALLIILIVIP